MSGGDGWIHNPEFRQRVRIIETPEMNGGKRIILEFEVEPRTGRGAVAMHLHPTFRETFEVLRGEGACLIGGVETQAKPGGVFEVPPGVSHWHPWSISDEELHFRQVLESEQGDLAGLSKSLRGGLALFARGKMDKNNTARLPGFWANFVLVKDLIPATIPSDLSSRPAQWLAKGLGTVGAMMGYGYVDREKGGG